MPSIPTAKPVVRRISVRGLSNAIEGPERAYPVYQFSGSYRYERPHRAYPFSIPRDVRITALSEPRITEDSNTRITEQ